MRVVHVCTAPTGAAYRLHTGLRHLGVDSVMFVAEHRGETNGDPTVMLFKPPTDPLTRLRRRLRRMQIARSFARYARTRPAGSGYFFSDRSPHGGDMCGQLPQCDLVHLHTMLELVDFQAFFAAVPRRTPVVRTLHDMSFFTGGCHYDWACGRFRQRCGACPQLGSHDEGDLSRRVWQRKHAALSDVAPARLYFVTPSQWMADMARASSLLRRFPIAVIPLSLDTDRFRPRDRARARDVLGIPQDAEVVLFVASPIDRPEKGFALLAQALQRVGDRTRLHLVSAGRGRPPVEVSVPHMHLGFVGNEGFMSAVYSAADVVVIPSVEDNSPQAALEAMACGVPIVGFAVGGIPELVRPGINGLLGRDRDVCTLSAAIRDLLGDPAQRSQMGVNGRRIAVEEYALEISARRYSALYQAILDGGTGSAGGPTGTHGIRRRDHGRDRPEEGARELTHSGSVPA